MALQVGRLVALVAMALIAVNVVVVNGQSLFAESDVEGVEKAVVDEGFILTTVKVAVDRPRTKSSSSLRGSHSLTGGRKIRRQRKRRAEEEEGAGFEISFADLEVCRIILSFFPAGCDSRAETF